MSPCSRGGAAAPAAPRTNRARLRAAPSPTETPRGALTTRGLLELLGTSLSRRHLMMRAQKGAQMTAIRAELQTVFLKKSCKYISVTGEIEFLYFKTVI